MLVIMIQMASQENDRPQSTSAVRRKSKREKNV